jgi:rod shape-determining protein MreD
MIMPRGKALLSPTSPSFIWITLLLALLLDCLPLGRVVWMPDLLAVVLMFWSIHQPRRVGLTVAFAFGLALDVHQAAPLGQNALSFSVLVYLANLVQRRIMWFPVLMQAVQLLPLFAAAHVITVALRLISGGAPNLTLASSSRLPPVNFL